MYSIAARFNKILFFGIINLAVLCFVNYLSGIFLLKGRQVEVAFEMKEDHKKFQFYRMSNKRHGAHWDALNGVFDYSINGVETLNNWNLKQLFFYFEVTWEGKNGRR